MLGGGAALSSGQSLRALPSRLAPAAGSVVPVTETGAGGGAGGRGSCRREAGPAVRRHAGDWLGTAARRLSFFLSSGWVLLLFFFFL